MNYWDPEAFRAVLRRMGCPEERIRISERIYDRKRFAEEHVKDRRGAPWTVRGYQANSLNCYAPRKVHCDGRDVGKTIEIELTALWASVALHGREMMIATQCEHHLYPLMNRVVRRFEEDARFARSIVEIKRTPSWHLRFSNGFVLWGRIAGPRGVNFQGMHVDFQIVDEAQELTETSWGELYQGLNASGWRWVYGVPNGRRETFFKLTQMQDAEQFNWPSSINPGYTKEKDAELQRLYGGESAPGYIHRVLGRHGTPAHGVFDVDDYLECVDEGLGFETIELVEGDEFAAPAEVRAGEYYLGCDLGYARDPSELVVYRSDECCLRNVLRVHLSGVNYARQKSVIESLDEAYRFRRIVIDAGNNGRGIAHELMVNGADWCGRLHAIEFGSGIALDPLPDGTVTRRPAKEFMTELLQRRMAERGIVFPKLAARESQYAGHSYHVGYNGRIVYEKGNDHLIDADRCAVLARWLDTRDEGESPALGIRFGTF